MTSRFTAVFPIPRGLYYDKPFLFDNIRSMWEFEVEKLNGIPAAGPLYLRELESVINPFPGYITIIVHGPAIESSNGEA
jgi:hypothetical protein